MQYASAGNNRQLVPNMDAQTVLKLSESFCPDNLTAGGQNLFKTELIGIHRQTLDSPENLMKSVLSTAALFNLLLQMGICENLDILPH